MTGQVYNIEDRGIMKQELISRLIQAAFSAREHAYAPYSSDFKVGASVLTDDDWIVSGCNVENASFGATMCAERVAVFKAISEGHRTIKAVAVVADSENPVPPCGICLQVISEFGADADIIMANTKGQIELSSVGELLPRHFKLRSTE